MSRSSVAEVSEAVRMDGRRPKSPSTAEALAVSHRENMTASSRKLAITGPNEGFAKVVREQITDPKLIQDLYKILYGDNGLYYLVGRDESAERSPSLASSVTKERVSGKRIYNHDHSVKLGDLFNSINKLIPKMLHSNGGKENTVIEYLRIQQKLVTNILLSLTAEKKATLRQAARIKYEKINAPYPFTDREHALLAEFHPNNHEESPLRATPGTVAGKRALKAVCDSAVKALFASPKAKEVYSEALGAEEALKSLEADMHKKDEREGQAALPLVGRKARRNRIEEPGASSAMAGAGAPRSPKDEDLDEDYGPSSAQKRARKGEEADKPHASPPAATGASAASSSAFSASRLMAELSLRGSPAGPSILDRKMACEMAASVGVELKPLEDSGKAAGSARAPYSHLFARGTKESAPVADKLCAGPGETERALRR